MYKFKREKQISFTDFNQPLGLQMNPDNRWVKKAAMIPWETIEDEYAKLFPSHTGMPAKPLRMALGSLLIQKQYHYPDEELVEQIRENPYYQYFIDLPGYEDKIPFVSSLLVEFRKGSGIYVFHITHSKFISPYVSSRRSHILRLRSPGRPFLQ